MPSPQNFSPRCETFCFQYGNAVKMFVLFQTFGYLGGGSIPGGHYVVAHYWDLTYRKKYN